MTAEKKTQYLHSDVVNKADPADGVLEKDVDLFLEGPSTFMVKHVFGFKRLIDGKIDGIVGIRHTGRLPLGGVRRPRENVSNLGIRRGRWWAIRVGHFITTHNRTVRVLATEDSHQAIAGGEKKKIDTKKKDPLGKSIELNRWKAPPSQPITCESIEFTAINARKEYFFRRKRFKSLFFDIDQSARNPSKINCKQKLKKPRIFDNSFNNKWFKHAIIRNWSVF